MTKFKASDELRSLLRQVRELVESNEAETKSAVDLCMSVPDHEEGRTIANMIERRLQTIEWEDGEGE